MRRLKVLISAYACEPGKGSEPGVGWNVAREMSRHHDVWVLTRANNRPAIEAALAEEDHPGPAFVYLDLPGWARWWKRGQRGVHAYYYLWQILAYFTARGLHREVGFDLVHHVTFVKYWAPSFLALLPIPFLWGPVGGGESTPAGFWRDLGFRGMAYEVTRVLARWLAEKDPLVRLTARRNQVALATTEATAERLRRLGARKVSVLGLSALSSGDIARLSNCDRVDSRSVRFISVGRLLHLKAFHLSLRAFADANLDGVEYVLIGGGPERRRLERLAGRLGVANRVRFLGQMPREEALAHVCASDVLVHPSLHESGGWVCVEAMAAGKPVVCADLGGPAIQVTCETGFKLPARTSRQLVYDLAGAMRRLAQDDVLRKSMGRAARMRVLESFSWGGRAEKLLELYERVAAAPISAKSGADSLPHSHVVS